MNEFVKVLLASTLFVLALVGAFLVGEWIGSYTPADICVTTSDDGFDTLKKNSEVCLK
jgi:hypothetical protein